MADDDRYDAFGNPIKQSPLSGIPGGEEMAPRLEQTAAQPQPSSMRESTAWDTPRAQAQTLSSGREGRGGVGALALLIFVLFLGGVGFAAYSLISSVSDTVDRVRTTIDSATPSSPTPSSTTPSNASGEQPSGLSGASMLRAGNLRASLSRLRSGGHGKLRQLRIAPERIDATLTDGTVINLVQLRADGTRTIVKSTGSPGSLEPTPFASLEPAGPERLVRRAAARLKLATTEVDYVVAARFSGKTQLYVYFEDAKGSFAADAAGHIERRIN